MLECAGVDYRAIPADLDESAVKSANPEAGVAAAALADAKALHVSRDNPDDWVIGSDSIVACDGRMLDKPKDRSDAEEHLRFFSGRDMALTSAVSLARGGAIVWRFTDQANLRVRHLSDEFIAHYLDTEWPDVSYCVGVFRMEGRGVQLFESIEGSHFTILGMPLFPLLGALRERGVIAQ